ncbi:arylsulfotransferase family protein [Salinispora arenicola]|uniref:arylsulfotransferase family protein n=1 Tax=Salinispora arenicola TaxID=168697 RepID=UPI00036450C0|nr:arylsulfotransferase family protein [Salinispora arenicola]
MIERFAFSPSSSYPRPFARLVNRNGELLHTWAHPAAQPTEADNPPTWLRGWNHVEVAPDGGLFALVPLHAVLRLDRDSHLMWITEIPAHHDLYSWPDGSAHVLTEVPRVVEVDRQPWTILDNEVVALDSLGRISGRWSLYDVLSNDRDMAKLLGAAVAAGRDRHLTLGPHHPATTDLLRTGRKPGTERDVLRALRSISGRPSDMLHANALEPLSAHPAGLWGDGCWLLSFRELDLIAVIDFDSCRLVWWWGPGILSGQHQPSAQADGRVLLYDNGRAHRRTRLLEVDPGTNRLTWEYAPPGLFAAVAGGCERLPQGTVLVTDPQVGRAFEVDRSGRELWSWTVPARDCPPGQSRVSIYRFAAVDPARASRAVGED